MFENYYLKRLELSKKTRHDFLLFSGIILGLLGIGYLLNKRDIKNYDNSEKANQLENILLSPYNPVDLNQDGQISYSEEYLLRTKMGIQDSSRDYKPTLEQIQKAYDFYFKDNN